MSVSLNYPHAWCSYKNLSLFLSLYLPTIRMNALIVGRKEWIMIMMVKDHDDDVDDDENDGWWCWS